MLLRALASQAEGASEPSDPPALAVATAAAAVRAAAVGARTRVSEARRLTLYEAGRHLDWHGAQLWAPMAFAHAMLQGADAALALAPPPPAAPGIGLQRADEPPAPSRGAALGIWQRLIGCPHACRRALRERHRWHRAARVTLAVVVAAGAAIAAAPALDGGLNPFWAPVTAAFVAGGSEAGSFRTMAQRLHGTLLGASAGLGAALLCGAEPASLALVLGVWSGVSGVPGKG